ncbi:MAG: hypothetical protein P1V34_15570 [Alphaproteobacteria bacterium]|nr:hypothetical protein [Alphaproteobacteria bacterium]
MRRMMIASAILLMSVSFLPVQAEAQNRDRALESVRTLTQDLIGHIQDGSASDRQVWAGVQGLTDVLRRFILSETEIRAEDKVAPPIGAALRPGEAEITPSTQPGTDEVTLSQVSTEWFNAQATKTQEALELVRDGLEQNISNSDLILRLQGVLKALANVNRPPEG